MHHNAQRTPFVMFYYIQASNKLFPQICPTLNPRLEPQDEKYRDGRNLWLATFHLKFKCTCWVHLRSFLFETWFFILSCNHFWPCWCFCVLQRAGLFIFKPSWHVAYSLLRLSTCPFWTLHWWVGLQCYCIIKACNDNCANAISCYDWVINMRFVLT